MYMERRIYKCKLLRQWIIKIYKFFTLNRDEYPYHKAAEINEIKNSSNV